MNVLASVCITYHLVVSSVMADDTTSSEDAYKVLVILAVIFFCIGAAILLAKLVDYCYDRQSAISDNDSDISEHTRNLIRLRLAIWGRKPGDSDSQAKQRKMIRIWSVKARESRRIAQLRRAEQEAKRRNDVIIKVEEATTEAKVDNNTLKPLGFSDLAHRVSNSPFSREPSARAGLTRERTVKFSVSGRNTSMAVSSNTTSPARSFSESPALKREGRGGGKGVGAGADSSCSNNIGNGVSATSLQVPAKHNSTVKATPPDTLSDINTHSSAGMNSLPGTCRDMHFSVEIDEAPGTYSDFSSQCATGMFKPPDMYTDLHTSVEIDETSGNINTHCAAGMLYPSGMYTEMHTSVEIDETPSTTSTHCVAGTFKPPGAHTDIHTAAEMDETLSACDEHSATRMVRPPGIHTDVHTSGQMDDTPGTYNTPCASGMLKHSGIYTMCTSVEVDEAASTYTTRITAGMVRPPDTYTDMNSSVDRNEASGSNNSVTAYCTTESINTPGTHTDIHIPDVVDAVSDIYTSVYTRSLAGMARMSGVHTDKGVPPEDDEAAGMHTDKCAGVHSDKHTSTMKDIPSGTVTGVNVPSDIVMVPPWGKHTDMHTPVETDESPGTYPDTHITPMVDNGPDARSVVQTDVHVSTTKAIPSAHPDTQTSTVMAQELVVPGHGGMTPVDVSSDTCPGTDCDTTPTIHANTYVDIHATTHDDLLANTVADPDTRVVTVDTSTANTDIASSHQGDIVHSAVDTGLDIVHACTNPQETALS